MSAIPHSEQHLNSQLRVLSMRASHQFSQMTSAEVPACGKGHTVIPVCGLLFTFWKLPEWINLWYKKYKPMLELSVIYQLKAQINHGLFSILPASLAARAIVPWGCYENSSEACRAFIPVSCAGWRFQICKTTYSSWFSPWIPKKPPQNGQTTKLASSKHWN